MNAYKYSIKEKLNNLNRNDYKKLKKQIPNAIYKSPRTFDRYCNLTMDSFSDIPAQDLDIIASALSCKADDLKNYVVKNLVIKKNIMRKR